MASQVSPRYTPDRDVRYMGLAWMVASFSKDPNTQVGAVLINPDKNEPLGWGYNGPPANVIDSKLDWGRPQKYDWVIHAEENAIIHSRCDLTGADLYVTHMPCKRCILRLVDQRIKRIVYTQYYVDKKSIINTNAADLELIKEIAKAGDVELEEFSGNIAWMQDWILHMRSLGAFEISVK